MSDTILGFIITIVWVIAAVGFVWYFVSGKAPTYYDDGQHRNWDWNDWV